MRAFREYFRTPPSTSRPTTGLFGIKSLSSPRSLVEFGQQSLTKAQVLAAKLQPSGGQAQGPGLDDNAKIRTLDELSDTLCKAVDLSAFVRISHPNPNMADSAQTVHENLFAYMTELNTQRDLLDIVNAALADPAVQGEERKTAEILRHDFLKSGIQFDNDPHQKEKFIDLSNSISIKGQHFLMGLVDGDPAASDEQLLFSPSELAGVSPTLLAKLATSTRFAGRKIRIPLSQPHIAEHVLATAANPETRKRVWHALRTAPEQQRRLLTDVLKERRELARLAGFETYADYELGDKLLHDSASVKQFLTSLSETVRPLASAEMARIGSPKAPWDYAYTLARYRSQIRGTLSPPTFQLFDVFATINDLTTELYGLRLEPVDVSPGETWAPEVKRLDVYDGHEKVGTIYCDLLSRPGKHPNPAHFTIQCSRRHFPSKEMQLPIIALVCDFVEGRDGSVFLQYHEVQTLFHEMGHAIHSMIGRTDLHNVAGTRCATDFVELPSILFEKFASDPIVLEKMKPGFNAREFLTKQARVDAATENRETWHQLRLSTLDQALHGPEFAKALVHEDPAQTVANDITRTFSLFPAVQPEQMYTQQYAQFGHLVSYGATYYSYLLDRCLAKMVWDHLFKDPQDWQAGGEKFKTAVLQWGGAKDPQACLESLLGRKFDAKDAASSLAPRS